ncbi:hypothetical protein MBLNU459_g0713t1 [Dothideomycetes sp. NU459]
MTLRSSALFSAQDRNEATFNAYDTPLGEGSGTSMGGELAQAMARLGPHAEQQQNALWQGYHWQPSMQQTHPQLLRDHTWHGQVLDQGPQHPLQYAPSLAHTRSTSDIPHRNTWEYQGESSNYVLSAAKDESALNPEHQSPYPTPSETNQALTSPYPPRKDSYLDPNAGLPPSTDTAR